MWNQNSNFAYCKLLLIPSWNQNSKYFYCKLLLIPTWNNIPAGMCVRTIVLFFCTDTINFPLPPPPPMRNSCSLFWNSNNLVCYCYPPILALVCCGLLWIHLCLMHSKTTAGRGVTSVEEDSVEDARPSKIETSFPSRMASLAL
jgi:hypothetical protein